MKLLNINEPIYKITINIVIKYIMCKKKIKKI